MNALKLIIIMLVPTKSQPAQSWRLCLLKLKTALIGGRPELYSDNCFRESVLLEFLLNVMKTLKTGLAVLLLLFTALETWGQSSAPAIITQPANQVAEIGSDTAYARFYVDATGAQPLH